MTMSKYLPFRLSLYPIFILFHFSYKQPLRKETKPNIFSVLFKMLWISSPRINLGSKKKSKWFLIFDCLILKM